MADSPVQVNSRAEEVQGQAHGQVTPPKHDGVHFVEEVSAVTDRVITDVNDPLAVQVPEGVGASHYGHRSPLGQALAVGTPQEQFDAAAKDSNAPSSDQKVTDAEAGKDTAQPEAASSDKK